MFRDSPLPEPEPIKEPGAKLTCVLNQDWCPCGRMVDASRDTGRRSFFETARSKTGGSLSDGSRQNVKPTSVFLRGRCAPAASAAMFHKIPTTEENVKLVGVKMRNVCILLLVLLPASFVADARKKGYYTAAVLEHHRLGDPESDPPQEIVRKNLNIYRRAVSVAKSKGADIVVFPELGIFPPNTRAGMKPYLEYVPDPRTIKCNPCNNRNDYANRTTLLTLSCLAKNNRIVLVANVADVQPCTGAGCPEDGVYQYNTNVAFDRDGTLLTRYHKVHLFYEDGTDYPNYPQDPVFSTDFGTFATYICFDIWFNDIVETAKKVDNIAFPTLWYSTMPILNSLQVWEAFSFTNNVTLLASNINYPDFGNTGTGIFTPTQGATRYTLNNDGLSKLVVSKVPLPGCDRNCPMSPKPSITVITEHGTHRYSDDGEGSNLGPICDRRILEDDNTTVLDYRCLHDNTENYTFTKLTERSNVLESCQNGMCCSLNYSTVDMKDDFYLGVHNQTYSAGGRYFWCLEACVVLRCERFSNRTCATFPMESQTTFSHLALKANFSSKYVYASVLKNRLRIATFEEWSHSIQETESGTVMSQLNYGGHASSPAVVAALVGRCYDRDPPYVP